MFYLPITASCWSGKEKKRGRREGGGKMNGRKGRRRKVGGKGEKGGGRQEGRI